LHYAISTERLGRRYGQIWAVRDLTLNIARGEVFGILGPNGAGKTSTMRMLACLVAPTAGGASVCGYDISKSPTDVRKRVGILTDSAGLYESLSAQENLEFFAKLYDLETHEIKERAEYYLKLLGLWDRRRSPAGTFSSGMKQKLSMARALIHEPEVLLLDEPTSALDPEGAKLVRDFISSLKGEGRTIVLCTHNLAEAQSLCDRVAIIKRTLLRVGTPRQLQTSLYGRQVEVRVGNLAALTGDGYLDPTEGNWVMNDLAVKVAAFDGVGDVAVSGERLLVSMEDPDRTTPHVVRWLVNRGVDVVRVAEVEHSLERAYLDLVARQDEISTNGQNPKPAEEVAA
jgi:ABC-2 type transport system ATP-binding protein